MLLLLTLTPDRQQSQTQNLDTFDGCPMEGSAKTECTQERNRLKNRWDKEPTAGDINADVTLAEMLRKGNDEDRWSDEDGAEITGYVASVEPTGAESCNCDDDSEGHTDLHINVVASPKVANSQNYECRRVIVEITPRWQFLKHWTFDQVRSEIEHKWVTFRGWMFFDRYHLHESYNTRNSKSTACGGKKGPFPCNGPKGKTLWRASAWEIHPVTSYTVLSGPPQ